VSLSSRIKEAEAAWKEGRKEKALLAALSAANDTARKRYPAKSGKEALSHFLTDAVGQLAEGGIDLFDWSFHGGVSLGEVLHEVHRSLLDSGSLPADVELVPGEPFAIHQLPGNRRGYSECLVPRLIEIVKQVPENRQEFSKRK
jgi:hypothetical protein